MNLTAKVAASFVAVAALSAILFPIIRALALHQAQSPIVVAAAFALISGSAAANAVETPPVQLDDLHYN